MKSRLEAPGTVRRHRSALAAPLVICLLFLPGVAGAQIPPLVPTLQVPGYEMTLFHRDLQATQLTSLSVDDLGRIYVCYMGGQIRVLEDIDGDRDADQVTVFWPGTYITPPLVGALWHEGKVYVAHAGSISRIEDTDGDLVGDEFTNLVTGLPVAMHQNNQLFTDRQWLYFGVGSLTDHSLDADPRASTLMRVGFDGAMPTIYATGLRNIYDGAVHPVTGDIIAGENGPNFVPGNLHPPDEIVRIIQGLDYGHPYNWGFPPPGSGFEPPICEILPHASPTGVVFNPNTAISGYRDDYFMCAFGNYLIGALVRVRLLYGELTGILGTEWELFITDLANPIDIVALPNGELLLANFTDKTIYVIHPKSDAVITVEGQPSIGMTCPITFRARNHPGHTAFALASHDLGFPIALGGGMEFYLELNSPLVDLSITPGNGILDLPFPALLDATGTTTGSLTIPNELALIGLQLQLQFLVVDPAGALSAVSPPQGVSVLPPF